MVSAAAAADYANASVMKKNRWRYSVAERTAAVVAAAAGAELGASSEKNRKNR